MNFRRSVTVLILGVVLLGAGCSSGPTADDRFVVLANNYLDRMLELNPEWATSLGDHRFDDRISDLSENGFQVRVDFNRAYLDTLAGIDSGGLSRANRIDYEILKEQCESVIFMLTEVQEYKWNPTMYNPGDGIYNILARDYAPLPERLAAVKERLLRIPEMIEAARTNLNNPPPIMTVTAIKQNPGVIHLVMDGLQPYLDEAPEMKDELRTARSRAIAALDHYGRWLESDLLPRSNGNFRLGKDLWRKKLKFALSSDLTPEEILASAESDLVTTRDRMYETALPLFRDYFGGHVDDTSPGKDGVIRRVLARLADDHPTNETIVPQAREDLEKITEFVRKEKLVDVPGEPLEVIVMPEHQRGLAIGYCNSPGPLEKNGTTFYAISPTPRDWTAERAETFFREYNDYMLMNLTIHEAMPGHYLQISHSNRFEASTPLRAILSSGTFVEGWATYAEQLMVEAGYGGPELHLQQLKMRLRLIINAIIDQKIHTAGMTEGEAMEMMMIDGFQEEGEAAGKWIRAQLSSTQLSTYFVGNMEINGLRRDYEKKVGKKFDMNEFHNELLSFGSPAPKYVGELMDLN
ncbi:MAG: DUF885 domain-containing protein [Candidatus Krumholzibacteria bacterium]|nr:DUF885 domain-containing protein [Candidatus Krumholzibacteria bacterium]